MSRVRAAWLSLRALVRRGAVEAELDEELRFHLEKEVEERMRRGATREEARAAALRAFGGVERFKEECRDVRGVRWLEEGVQDVRLSWRTLWRTPLFAAVALLTLALGIGATTSVFSVVHGVLLRPLPYAAPDALVRLYNSWAGEERGQLSPAEYLDYRARLPAFSQLAVHTSGPVSLTGEGEPQRVVAGAVSSSLFPALGIPPQLGRTFTPEEERPGHAVAVLSHALWQERFGGREDALGRSLTVDGTPHTVVGVMPAGFTLPDALDGGRRPDLFLPLGLDATSVDTRGSHYLQGLARLAPGVSLAQGDAAFRTVAEGFRTEYPDAYPPGMRFSAHVVPLQEDVVGPVRPVLLLLFGAVGLVLLIVCANLANLLLARTEARGREVAIRVALGAGVGRLVRQLLAESLLLAVLGGALGVGLAALATRGLLALAPPEVPRLSEVGLQPAVLLFALLASLLTGVAFGLVPALHAARGTPLAAMREGGRGATAGRARQGVRRALVVAEVALALVLVLGAGLLTQSLVRLLRVDPGFTSEGALSVSLALPEAGYAEDGRVVRFFRELDAAVAALPGVRAVGSVAGLPLATVRGDLSFELEGRPTPAGERKPSADWQVVTPGYFEAVGMRLLRGRALLPEDAEGAPGAVVVNEAFVRRHFPREEALGRRFVLGGGAGPGQVTVVGVVADVRHAALDAEVEPEMYLPHAQFRFWGSQEPLASLTLVVRTRGEPAALFRPVREAIRGLDAQLPVDAFRTLEEVRAASVAGPRFVLWLLSVFSGCALLIALVGVYGVMAYTVAQRRGEFGIRMALGALPRDVLRLVLSQGLKLSAVGIGVGLLAALALGRLLSGLLYEVSPADPLTLLAGAGVLSAACAVACWVPAWRATRVDPAETLRG